MFRGTATALLLSGLLILAAPADEDGIYSCKQSNGTLFFTDDPKHYPANCQPYKREPGQGGLILVPGSALPEKREKSDAPGGPWRIDDWRLRQGERTRS